MSSTLRLVVLPHVGCYDCRVGETVHIARYGNDGHFLATIRSAADVDRANRHGYPNDKPWSYVGVGKIVGVWRDGARYCVEVDVDRLADSWRLFGIDVLPVWNHAEALTAFAFMDLHRQAMREKLARAEAKARA